VETSFPAAGTPQDINFWTKQVGHIDPHLDGSRALGYLTGQGRLLEVDLQRGRALRELINCHDLHSAGRQFGTSSARPCAWRLRGYVGRRHVSPNDPRSYEE
jgi:hypothetical protein